MQLYLHEKAQGKMTAATLICMEKQYLVDYGLSDFPPFMIGTGLRQVPFVSVARRLLYR